MQILARANGFALRDPGDAFRICWLADTFRKIYKIGNMRIDLENRASTGRGDYVRNLPAGYPLASK